MKNSDTNVKRIRGSLRRIMLYRRISFFLCHAAGKAEHWLVERESRLLRKLEAR